MGVVRRRGGPAIPANVSFLAALVLASAAAAFLAARIDLTGLTVGTPYVVQVIGVADIRHTGQLVDSMIATMP